MEDAGSPVCCAVASTSSMLYKYVDMLAIRVLLVALLLEGEILSIILKSFHFALLVFVDAYLFAKYKLIGSSSILLVVVVSLISNGPWLNTAFPCLGCDVMMYCIRAAGAAGWRARTARRWGGTLAILPA
jgi:hypothetical protein